MNYSAPVQDRTLLEANAHREPWTQDDLEFVVSMTEDERDEDIALALGRSLYAIWAIQHRMRVEGVAPVLASYASRVASVVAPTCGMHHIVLDALGNCDWC